MRLIASLPSSTPEAPEALVVCDLTTRIVDPVRLPEPGAGAFGLCLANGTLYCVIDQGRPVPEEPERSTLLALDPVTFEVMWSYEFRHARDAHSLAAAPGVLYVASTGTDEIVELRLDVRSLSSGRISQSLPGYARGLLFADGKLYVGTSRQRRPSEPQSILATAQ